MKLLLFSDLHAHAWSEFSDVVNYKGQLVNSRLADAAKVIDWVRRMAAKHAVDHVIFAGDLYHKKRVIDVPVFNLTAKALYRLADQVPLTVMAGNHDLTRRSAEASYSTEHALYALGAHRCITVVDQPTVYDGLGLIPYGSDRDTTLHGINQCVSQGATTLIMHAGIAGAVTGPVEFQPYEPVSVSDLPDMPVYSGHYHLPQTVQGRVTYIGAPLELVRGDGAAPRGAMIVEGSTSRRLRYKHGPSFLLCRAWDLDANLESVAGHFVDLQIRDTAEAEPALARLKDAGARSVRPVFVAATAAPQARLKVEVEDNGLPTVENLCQSLVKSAEERFDGDALWHLAQEALHAADTAEGSSV